MLNSVISGLSDCFEPDATAVHLTNVKNFLIGKHKDSDYTAHTYKNDVNWLRLALLRDLLIDQTMSTGQLLESFNDVVELLKRKEVFCELVPELTNLFKIMPMPPASKFTAKWSFSSLRCLKIYL